MKKTYEELEAEVKKGYEFSAIINRKVLELIRTQKELEQKLQESQSNAGNLQLSADALREKADTLEAENQALETLVAELNQTIVELGESTPVVRNGRRAGRKKSANKETVELVLNLRATGVSYVKISQVLEERLGVKLGRTTIGEIVRGTYVPPQECETCEEVELPLAPSC